MSKQLKIHCEVTRQLTAKEELLLLRGAYARNPSPILRARLGAVLLLADAFDAVIDLLAACEDRNFSEEMLLAAAYLARETPDDTARAAKVAERALALAGDDPARAAALAIRGKTETRRGDLDAARASLRLALDHNPLDKDACKRLAAIELAANNPATILAIVDELAAKGAAHARLFAARALAHARRGQLDVARATVGFGEFHRAQLLGPPPGWDSSESFNAALAEEMLAHPGLRYERYGTASEFSWRVDAPATRAAPLARALLDQIVAAIEDYVDRLEPSDHPWVSARPAEALLRSWCVITESEGFESWHVHQFGWLSGVYYVRVPASIAQGDCQGGCIAFGLPEDLAGEEAASGYGARLVRPQEGLMLAFPSHVYHRTFAHGSREKRICFAFDLRPT